MHYPKHIPPSCFAVSRRYYRQLSILRMLTCLYLCCGRPHYRYAFGYVVMKSRFNELSALRGKLCRSSYITFVDRNPVNWTMLIWET